MAGKLYALLVGINNYPSDIGQLRGCVNDVFSLKAFLNENFAGDSDIKTLVDEQATYDNIVKTFRSQLRDKAGEEDAVLFQYSGHGARSKSADHFKKYFPEGQDEGLVCIDSREAGNFDLADKELAVLINEVAETGAHVSVVLDCCHSGSGTRMVNNRIRNSDEAVFPRYRQTHDRHDDRPLETYIDGFYSNRKQQGESLIIPTGKHVLMAACKRRQKAWETDNHSGLFTSSLLKVLQSSSPDISYADLFVRCRDVVRKKSDNQDPQFETYSQFSAYSGFLGRAINHRSRRYMVKFDKNLWQMEYGAIHGLPSDPDVSIDLNIYADSDSDSSLGSGQVVEVGPQKSIVEFEGFDAEQDKNYWAEVLSVPAPFSRVILPQETGDAAKVIADFLASDDGEFAEELATTDRDDARYEVLIKHDGFELFDIETEKLIQRAEPCSELAIQHIFRVLRQISEWERLSRLANPASQIETDKLNFNCFKTDPNGNEADQFATSDITADFIEDVEVPYFRLKASNGTSRTYFALLVHFSESFGTSVLSNDELPKGEITFQFQDDDGEHDYFNLTIDIPDVDEECHQFKLIVSTEMVDSFLIENEDIDVGGTVSFAAVRRGSPKGFGGGKARKRKEDWFTKDIFIKVVRRKDEVSDSSEVRLANNKIVIKPHESLTANVNLSSDTSTRSLDAANGADILRRRGFELLSLDAQRGVGDGAGEPAVLEFSSIENADSLAQKPLEIELDVELADDEALLPVTYDGEFFLLVGDASTDTAGVTHISVDHVPDIDDVQRSLGKALKMYFLRTFLRWEVNKLRWVDYSNGLAELNGRGVAEKVKTAKKVLLLVHGIIGDTQGIAEGLDLARDTNGQKVHEKFDVVLTYDYENLNMPIEETAEKLKDALHEVGIHKDDKIELTLLVHSMGGLVSRYFIEHLGGNEFVDHLVMCGTPNQGSPFGTVDEIRSMLEVLTTLGVNYVPAYVPYGAAALAVLNGAGQLTKTLGQMSTRSNFIRDLNQNNDPKVRYTAIAGDITDYEEDSRKIFPLLIAKLGRTKTMGALFGGDPHDIAVKDESIHGVDDNRSPPPDEQSIVCHHLNYFACDAGLQTLSKVNW